MAAMPARTPQTGPDFSREGAALARGVPRVVGIDEVGRGPLAGPVVAAAVCLRDQGRIPPGLDDSKRLSAARREALSAALHACAEIGIGMASPAEIDRLNIHGATMLAMHRALAALPHPPGYLLIDGNRLPKDLPCPAEAVVKGDARCLSIAAASIVAKVARDAIMAELDALHPGYGWAQNAGYPTAAHLAALQILGPTPHHRASFAPVRKMLCEEHFSTR
jgi:ribonuclease HII